jgi:hypothetical protein
VIWVGKPTSFQLVLQLKHSQNNEFLKGYLYSFTSKTHLKNIIYFL